ncbi:hypothetical protein PENTCL1PPCAC_22968 [Pristionchus entomophagus]|uniref:Uncharacterized protein n=1 Tax=Pristionchus entomophagus TaxID=358040 RepID=A0AAV5U2Y9_9BILA|nr:hypothetical protein PENTCL1PPCAC_22968 [Pristionchus entomophagus]
MLSKWGIVPSGPLNWNAVFDEQTASGSAHRHAPSLDSAPSMIGMANTSGGGNVFARPTKIGKRKSRGDKSMEGGEEDSFRESMKKKKRKGKANVVLLSSMVRLRLLLLAGLSAAQWNPNYNRYMAYNAVGYNNGAYPQTDYSGYKGNPDPVPQVYYKPDPPRPEFESNNGYDVIFTVAPPIPVAITNPHPSRISRGSTTPPPPPPPPPPPSPPPSPSSTIPWWEEEETTTTTATIPPTTRSPSTTSTQPQTPTTTTQRPMTTPSTQWWTKKTEKPRPTPTWSTIQWWVASSTRPSPITRRITTQSTTPSTTTTTTTTEPSTTTTTESPVIVRELSTSTPSIFPPSPSTTESTSPLTTTR